MELRPEVRKFAELMERELRPELQQFALAMESRLKENDHKGGWDRESPGWLYARLLEELAELLDALGFGSMENIRREAADVANYAMMIADVAGCLAAGARG